MQAVHQFNPLKIKSLQNVALDDLVFIVVLYKLNLEESATLNSLLNCSAFDEKKINLIVYDNSPSPATQWIVNSEKINLISYFCNIENPGISKAYNYGAAIAKKDGFKWIVLLDQDTIFPTDYISKLIDAINFNPLIKLFAPILKLRDGTPFSPSKYMHKRGYPVELEPGILSLKKYSPVNCGMTIYLNSFFKAGGYNEQITLDFADFQFIERFRKVYSDFFLFDAVAIQDFSNEEIDLKKLEKRFSIYCNCAKKCNRNSVFDDIIYLYPVLRHTFGLFLKTKSFSFFKILYINYF